MIEWILPLEIQSPNIKEHWSKTHSRNKKNANIITHKWMLEDDKPTPTCTVSIQRLYNPSKFQKRWDDDNWIGGCKGIRDTLSALLVPGLAPGQADNPKYKINFQYDQLTATQKGVRIVIKTKDEEEEDAYF